MASGIIRERREKRMTTISKKLRAVKPNTRQKHAARAVHQRKAAMPEAPHSPDLSKSEYRRQFLDRIKRSKDEEFVVKKTRLDDKDPILATVRKFNESI